MLSLKTQRKQFGRKFVFAVFVLFFSSIYLLKHQLFPHPRKLGHFNGQLFLYRDNSVLGAKLSEDEKWRFPTKLEKVPSFFLESLICLEDERFFFHQGIDPISVLRATAQNLSSRKIVSGASTLSMQTARLLNEHEKPSWSRKLKQSLFALYLEWLFTKNEILEMYLNFASFGGNIEGLKAASYAYFQKAPLNLSRKEQLFLLSLPQSPNRWNRRGDSHSLQEKFNSVMKTKLQRLKDCSLLNEGEKIESLSLRKLRRRSFVSVQNRPIIDLVSSANTAGSEITSLKKEFQEKISSHLKQKRDYFWQRNIRNAAVIVLDIGSGKILSAVSNFDNQLAKHEQQINALSARRPSGSTLKPFLFARSLEKGLITPKTLLEDIPTSFTGWSPQNFDENFRGLVNADLALTESLNIPFVKLLQKYGLSNFLHSFYQLPFGQAFFDQSHGLGSIIGGIDLSPLELASLYLALANNGLFGEISILETDQSSHRFQWISAQSALSVAEILKGHSQSQNFSQMIRDISWKTGTSHSRKDAWSIGFDKNHLVLVWLGNLKHESSPHLIGSLSAAPLMMEIFNLINFEANTFQKSHKQSNPISFFPAEVKVCQFSGLEATQDCPHKHKTLSLTNKGQELEDCPYHKKIEIDQLTQLRVNNYCNQNKNVREKSVLQIPHRFKKYLKGQWDFHSYMPPFHPDCKNHSNSESGFKITSPKKQNYWKSSRDHGKKMFISLDFDTYKEHNRVSCFVNGKQILHDHQIKSLTSPLKLETGFHRLLCIDTYGNSDQVSFQVI